MLVRHEGRRNGNFLSRTAAEDGGTGFRRLKTIFIINDYMVECQPAPGWGRVFLI
jgi:hypothetical protein